MMRKSFSLFLASLLLACSLSTPATAQTNWTALHSAADAAGNGEAMIVSRVGNSSATVQITGTFVAVITFEASVDGSNWSAVRAVNQTTGVSGTTAVAPGIYVIAFGAAESFRARISSYTSGSVTVSARAGAGLISHGDPAGGSARFSCTVVGAVAVTLTALGGQCATPGAGLSLYVTDINFSASVASSTINDGWPALKHGTGGACATGTTVLWAAYSEANTFISARFATPLKVTANNELCWMHAGAGSKSIVVTGYIAP